VRRARVRGAWSSTPYALQESHRGDRFAVPTLARNARKGQPQVVVIHGADAQGWASAPIFRVRIHRRQMRIGEKGAGCIRGTCSGRFRSFQWLRTSDKSGPPNCAWYAQTRSSVRLEDVRDWLGSGTLSPLLSDRLMYGTAHSPRSQIGHVRYYQLVSGPEPGRSPQLPSAKSDDY
jgi:hypothetical protein